MSGHRGAIRRRIAEAEREGDGKAEPLLQGIALQHATAELSLEVDKIRFELHVDSGPRALEEDVRGLHPS